jgi:MGT family glycosyltransferase
VYVTLGVLMRAAAGVPVLRAILDGLADEPLRVIVTLGPRLAPEELGPTPPNARVEGYVPQELLLPHCDLVVCHGGSGTLLGALDHGLPMLIVPVQADQPENARAVAAAGAGRVLPPEQLTPASVGAAVRALLEEPAYRAGAGRLQAELRALPPMEHAVHLLDGLASANRPGERA